VSFCKEKPDEEVFIIQNSKSTLEEIIAKKKRARLSLALFVFF